MFQSSRRHECQLPAEHVHAKEMKRFRVEGLKGLGFKVQGLGQDGCSHTNSLDKIAKYFNMV